MKKRGKQAEKQAWEVQFINIDLDTVQRRQMAAWDETGSETWEIILGLVGESCKFSLGFDAGNDTYIAALTRPKGDTASQGYCLTARGPDGQKALRALGYRIAIVLDGDFDSALQFARTRSDWD